MGYAATTILVYGVRLTPKDSKRVFEYLLETNEFFKQEGEIEYDDEDVLIESRENDNWGLQGRVRYYPNIYSEGTDSRIHDMSYEEGRNSTLGIYVASNGYAHEDVLADFMSINEKCIKNFDKYIKPILEDLNINFENSKMLIVNQTW